MKAQGQLDATLAALADPTRREILRRLTRGEARVTEIARPLPMTLNAVSKHIRVLEHAGLVRRRRFGREHFLTYNPRPMNEVTAWMERQTSMWTERLLRLDELLQQEKGDAR